MGAKGQEDNSTFLETKGSSEQRVRGGEPEGVRKHLLSKKVFLCSKKDFRRKKGF